jgi:hypothetical protein
VKSETNDKRDGQYEESEQNDNGDRIIELCNKKDFAVLNTFLLNINKFICIPYMETTYWKIEIYIGSGIKKVKKEMYCERC